MTLLVPLLLQAAAPPSSPGAPAVTPRGPGQPPATLMFEPVAMLIASFGDGAGRTSRAAMQAGVARTFAAVDTAGAGSLGYIAFADWAERWLGDRNALPSPFEVDADGDNRITLAELQAAFARTFDRLDVDRDGQLTRAELLTIRGLAGGDPTERGKRRRR